MNTIIEQFAQQCDNSIDQMIDIDKRECPKCEGRGWDYVDDEKAHLFDDVLTCTYCGGYGTITEGK